MLSSHSNKQEYPFEKCIPPNTSKAINDFQGKREHKPKVHFDGTNLDNLKSEKIHKKRKKESQNVENLS